MKVLDKILFLLEMYPNPRHIKSSPLTDMIIHKSIDAVGMKYRCPSCGTLQKGDELITSQDKKQLHCKICNTEMFPNYKK